MELNSSTSKALNEWIEPETWYTNHALDMRRFYNFVDQYAKEHGHDIDEKTLAEEIVRRLNDGGKITESLKNTIQSRISLAYSILKFIEQTGR